MKRLLLMKSLLVAILLGLGQSAWSQTTVTYDFTSYSARTLTNSGTKAFNSNSVNHNYASNLPEVHNRFAFQFAGTFSIENAGLYAQRSGGDHVGICGLAAGDKVTINFSQGAIMVRGDITNWTGNTSAWTNYTTGTEIPINAAGNLSFQAKTLCKISSIVIVTSATETMTAPAISSEANGSARTVTITNGASSLLSPVTTYYTTDGTDPTASSAKYTEPFDVTETCTVKAITISNSSAATASTVASQEINMDAVDVPTAAITAVDGVNRTVTFSCATVGATLYFSTNNGEAYTEGTSLVISKNTNIKVKATKGSSSAESEEMTFEAGTTITLNTPSWTKTGYAEGVSTVTLADNQSNILLTPTSTIKYQINDGAEQTYSSAISVNDGETLKYWSEAIGYTSSTVGSIVAMAPNASVAIVSENYVGTVSENNNLSLADGEGYRQIYYNAGADLVSRNLLASNINSGTYFQMYRANGLYASVGWNLAIPDLKAGDYVTLNGVYGNGAFAISGASNMTADEWNSTAGRKYCYTVDTDGQVTFTMARYGYLTSITIQRATVSKTITAGWATYCSPYALDFSSPIDNLEAAYIVTGGNGTTLTTTPITSTIPANTGILLKGSGECVIPVVASSTTDVSANKLRGVTAETPDVAAGIYVLLNGSDNTSGPVGFYKTNNAFTVGANTAYLPSGFDARTDARAFYSLFDSETTGVGATLVNNGTVKNEIFNMQGQRVSQPTKGLYIVNGKKIIVK